MTAVQLTLDYEPTRPDPPPDRTPTRHDCRQHEMRDMRGQHAAPHALWTATTIQPAEEYL